MISYLLISSPPGGYVAYFLSVFCASHWDEFKMQFWHTTAKEP